MSNGGDPGNSHATNMQIPVQSHHSSPPWTFLKQGVMSSGSAPQGISYESASGQQHEMGQPSQQSYAFPFEPLFSDNAPLTFANYDNSAFDNVLDLQSVLFNQDAMSASQDGNELDFFSNFLMESPRDGSTAAAFGFNVTPFDTGSNSHSATLGSTVSAPGATPSVWNSNFPTRQADIAPLFCNTTVEGGSIRHQAQNEQMLAPLPQTAAAQPLADTETSVPPIQHGLLTRPSSPSEPIREDADWLENWDPTRPEVTEHQMNIAFANGAHNILG